MILLSFQTGFDDVHIDTTPKRKVFFSSVPVILFTTQDFLTRRMSQFRCQNALPEPAYFFFVCVCFWVGGWVEEFAEGVVSSDSSVH